MKLPVYGPEIGIALEPEKLGYGIAPATSWLVKDSPELSETIKALREAFLLNELPKYSGFFSGMIENSGGPIPLWCRADISRLLPRPSPRTIHTGLY